MDLQPATKHAWRTTGRLQCVPKQPCGARQGRTWARPHGSSAPRPACEAAPGQAGSTSVWEDATPSATLYAGLPADGVWSGDGKRRPHSAHQEQQAQQLLQRLAPPAPIASATKLPARGGAYAGGVALGMLVMLALQLVGQWVRRQRWARQAMDMLDQRRNSGSSASTSGPGSGSCSDSGSDAGASFDQYDSWSGDELSRRSSTASRPRSRSDIWSGQGSEDFPPSPSAASGASSAADSATSSVAGDASAVTSAWLDAAAEAVGAAAAGATAGTSSGSSSFTSNGTAPGTGPAAGPAASAPAQDAGETVEWVNMCWRKVWRVYQRGLERWIIDLLQPVFDGLVKDGSVPRWLCRLRIVELTLDHEAPYFSNMRRRNSRKDSDLNGIADVRYTGGARMLLMLELGEGRWRFKVPVLVSDLDLECQMWIKLRLAPMCPWIGTISLAFAGPPIVKVQLSPYNRVRLMRVPVVQSYLRKLLTVDLPGLMVLPNRLDIPIPPSVTTIAEAAVGRDTIMRAVASAVLQADAVEAALLAALPLGPQTPAGGISLPESFKGELSVSLRQARDLPVWGFPGQSNPYCRLVLGEQAVQSRREGDTSHPGRHRHPIWNQEFQFLVEDPEVQTLDILVKDSHLTGRTEVGRASIKLSDIVQKEGGKCSMWVMLQPTASYTISGGPAVAPGEVLMDLTYKSFDDDEDPQLDSGYKEADSLTTAQAPITDIRSAAAASSAAAVAASAAMSAIAMTKAAAARAAARAAKAAQDAAAAAAGAAKGAVDQAGAVAKSAVDQATGVQAGQHQQHQPQHQQQYQKQLPPPPGSPPAQLPAAGGTTASKLSSLPPVAASSTARRASKGGLDGDKDGRGPPSSGAASSASSSAPGSANGAAEHAGLNGNGYTNGNGHYANGVEVRPGGGAIRQGSAPEVTIEAEATAVVPVAYSGALAASQAGTRTANGHSVSSSASTYGTPLGRGGASAGLPLVEDVIVFEGRGDSGSSNGWAGYGGSNGNGNTGDHAHGARTAGADSGSSGGEGQAPLAHAVEQQHTVHLPYGNGHYADGSGLHPMEPFTSREALNAATADAATQTLLDALQRAAATQTDATASAPGTAQQQPQPSSEQPSDNWLASFVAQLPWPGKAGPPPSERMDDAHKAAGKAAAADSDAPAAAAADGGGAPWWNPWAKAEATADGKAHEVAQQQQQQEEEAQQEGGSGSERPWWQFWGGGDAKEGKEAKGENEGDASSRPVEAIVIPPDLPLEEIAAEVARLKEDSWRNKSDHVSSLWMKAVERNDRKWLMLAAFLLSVAVGLLTIVAWRLEHLEKLQAMMPSLTMMTMLAALEALLRSAGGEPPL